MACGDLVRRDELITSIKKDCFVTWAVYVLSCLLFGNQFAQVFHCTLFDFESVCYSNIFTASTKNFTWRARGSCESRRPCTRRITFLLVVGSGPQLPTDYDEECSAGNAITHSRSPIFMIPSGQKDRANFKVKSLLRSLLTATNWVRCVTPGVYIFCFRTVFKFRRYLKNCSWVDVFVYFDNKKKLVFKTIIYLFVTKLVSETNKFILSGAAFVSHREF